MLQKNCLYCGKSFLKPVNERLKDWKNRHKYCSKKCQGLNRRGKTNKKQRETLKNSYRTGKITTWNKGLKGFNSEEKNPYWKGDKVGYCGLHKWVQLHLGKPVKCEHCGKEATGHQMHWANRDHSYKRNLNDWIRLCSKCHEQYDKVNKLK